MGKKITPASFADPDVYPAVELAAAGVRPALPVELVLAVVMVESGGNSYAWNPEPHYRWLWDCRKGEPFRTTSEQANAKAPPPGFHPPRGLYSDRDAEFWGQQASWGALQVMGAVARELGFDRHFPRLCRPELGTMYGAMHLANLRRRFHRSYGWPGVVAAFNAGSPRRDGDGFVNQAYVDKVAKWVDLASL